jgi:hypothetical protein
MVVTDLVRRRGGATFFVVSEGSPIERWQEWNRLRPVRMTQQETTVLKKAGIVVATAAAGLLAVSPLAFAGDTGEWGHHGGGDSHSTHTNINGDTSKGFVNVADNNVNVPVQACNNDVPIQGGVAQAQVPVKNVTAALSGALAIFGKASSSVDQVTDNSRICGDNSGSAGDKHKQ